uniref:Secreted protein n=1 Tax=Acinetobacter phage vB_Ab_1137_KEN_03 TaxID=3158853 RepID=A0AAU8KX35_9CAUD
MISLSTLNFIFIQFNSYQCISLFRLIVPTKVMIICLRTHRHTVTIIIHNAYSTTLCSPVVICRYVRVVVK